MKDKEPWEHSYEKQTYPPPLEYIPIPGSITVDRAVAMSRDDNPDEDPDIYPVNYP
jgi:hypothetical protein